MIKFSTEALTEWARLAAEEERRIDERREWVAAQGPDEDVQAAGSVQRPAPDTSRAIANVRRSPERARPFGGHAIYELRTRLREQGRPKAA